MLRYANVSGARSLGGQIDASLETPGEYFRLDANATYQDFRNTSETGPFAAFNGDRIPNQPYLFANDPLR